MIGAQRGQLELLQPGDIAGLEEAVERQNHAFGGLLGWRNGNTV